MLLFVGIVIIMLAYTGLLLCNVVNFVALICLLTLLLNVDVLPIANALY
jgi:hypothetical protein